jgi:HD-GYP domain-containing protein (c-di-GMP phosphodiesterase class II)
LEITKHPIIAFEAVQDSIHVSGRAKVVAYQIHERCNGRGYPRRREGNQIHYLAKVAGIADAFVGLVSPRPHRPAVLPYRAIEKIVHGTKAGLYEPSAVRALLHTTSLFPIGSYVELTDGRVGRVIRSTGATYDRPIVPKFGCDVSGRLRRALGWAVGGSHILYHSA